MPETLTNIPSNRTLTDEQIALLSGIFRIIMKEITTDADKKSLAPGEPGIDYSTGVMYVRDPHTGNLVTPNGVEQMRMIMNHFDVLGNLNSDFLKDLAVYTDITEIPEQLPNTTPDTIVSHMTHVPSAFVGPIESDSVEWPSNKGIFIAMKYDEETVLVRFMDQVNNTAYYGVYNGEQHQFDGWVAYYSLGPYSTSELTDRIEADLDIQVKDMVTFTVKLVNGLEPNSKVIVNGVERSMVDAFGNPIDYAIAENNSIMLIYDEQLDAWVLNESGDSATLAGVEMLQRRVSSLNQDVLDLAESTTTRFEELSDSVDQRIADIRSDTDEKIDAVNDRVDSVVADVTDLQTNSATKDELSAATTAIDNKFNNFDAAWVKSINGSKLPLTVIPEGALEQLFIIPNLAVLADKSATGYPKDASNGDTLKDQDSGVMYYIKDETVLGTPNYAEGIEEYTAGKASYVDWENVNATPSTLDGYGITDAVSLTTYQSLQDRVTSLEAKVAALEARIDNIVANPGKIDVRFFNYTAVGGETTITNIEDFDPTKDKLFVNYGQTILKVGIDYLVNATGIRLISVTPAAGDVVQFIIFKQ